MAQSGTPRVEERDAHERSTAGCSLVVFSSQCSSCELPSCSSRSQTPFFSMLTAQQKGTGSRCSPHPRALATGKHLVHQRTFRRFGGLRKLGSIHASEMQTGRHISSRNPDNQPQKPWDQIKI